MSESINIEDMLSFAREHHVCDVESVFYVTKWKDYDVYGCKIALVDGKPLCIGLPQYILIKDGQMRMSAPYENIEIIEAQ